MERSDVTELHYITSVRNLASIASHGLLSHDVAAAHEHISVADEDVQGRRARKKVPNGAKLHSYANLYFDARNAMMYVVKDRVPPVVVVQVSPDVLDLPNTVVTDGNAASDPTRFYPSPSGLANLDKQRVFAKYWTHPDLWDQAERRRQRCAEVLTPQFVPPTLITGLLVKSDSHIDLCKKHGLRTEVKPYVFFD